MPNIRISQGNRSRYSFKTEWFEANGPLYGDNILCRLVRQGHPEIKLPHGRDDDPDYLLLIWMYAAGERWQSLLVPAEINHLHMYYKSNGFDFMLPELEKKQNELNDTYYHRVIKIFSYMW